jgi:pimeloyl-ACP methyl ester carboxylesterase
MATLVRVHGARHDGSAWNSEARYLESRRHLVFAPTILGNGKFAAKNVSHADGTNSTVRFVADHSLTDLIPVGHSSAGTILSKVAEAIPEKIRRLVFQNAFVLEDGHGLMDEAPPEHAALFEQLARESSDRSITIPFPMWRESFVNDGDPEMAKWTYTQLSAPPYQACADELDWKTILFARDAEELHPLHGGPCVAPGQSGMESADAEPPGTMPTGADAG